MRTQLDTSLSTASSRLRSRVRPTSSSLRTSTSRATPLAELPSRARSARTSSTSRSLLSSAYVFSPASPCSSPRVLDLRSLPCDSRPQSSTLTMRTRQQPNGIEKIHPIGSLSAYEATLLKAALPELSGSISSAYPLFRLHTQLLTNIRARRGCRIHRCQALEIFPYVAGPD